MNTSFQFGGALALAVVTAVNDATSTPGDTPQALLDGFHATVVVSLVAAVIGVVVTLLGVRRRATTTSSAASDCRDGSGVTIPC